MIDLPGCVLAANSGFPTDALIEVYGRLHLLVLHFPIALLIVAACVELWRAVVRQKTLASATVVCMVLGGLGAAVAASSGWIHADHSSWQGESVLDLHRWLGVASAGLAFVAAMFALVCILSKGTAMVPWTRVLILLSAATVGVASHFGGSMAWGENYVIAPLMPKPEPLAISTPEVTPDEAELGPESAEPAADDGVRVVSFEQDVVPILSQHCYRCHGESRQRGGIRLDSLDLVLAEVEPGEPDESYLIEVLRLPEDDDLHMPKNKPSLPDEQIETIALWIAGLGAAEQITDPTPPVVEEFTPVIPVEPDVVATDYEPPPSAPWPTLDAEQRASRDAAIARARNAGLIANVVSQNTDVVEVRVGGGASSIGDDAVAALAGLEPALVVLDLSGSAVTDAALERLGTFPHLRRLRLGETAVTDAGLRHLAGLDELESLDLHMTAVTDAGLEACRTMERLRSLYLWRTQVTQTGAAGLRAARPWLEVDLGSQ